jgi:hypothetical protein
MGRCARCHKGNPTDEVHVAPSLKRHRRAFRRAPELYGADRGGIEGRISVLMRGRGMKRCLAEGPEHFALFVGAAVLAKCKAQRAEIMRVPFVLTVFIATASTAHAECLSALKLCGPRIPGHTRCGGCGCQGTSARSAGTQQARQCRLTRQET